MRKFETLGQHLTHQHFNYTLVSQKKKKESEKIFDETIVKNLPNIRKGK